MKTTIRLLASGIVLAALTGCASLVAPPYSTDYEALERLKKPSLEKLAVGKFQPTDSAAPVNRVTLRGTRLNSPSGSFPKYLEDALISDLRDVSLYDSNSQLRIDALVLKNDIDISGVSVGTGVMEVEIAIERSGKPRLKKVYKTDIQFDSSFAGAVAIPKGQTSYGALVRTLLAQVYSDTEFINAISK